MLSSLDRLPVSFVSCGTANDDPITFVGILRSGNSLGNPLAVLYTTKLLTLTKIKTESLECIKIGSNINKRKFSVMIIILRTENI